MSRFQANCVALFALICCMFAIVTPTNAGCYSGHVGLGARISERLVERAEARLERAEARAEARAARSSSCVDSASLNMTAVYSLPATKVVTSEQSCSSNGSCSIQSAPASVTVKIQPAPIYATVVPMQSVRTTTTETRTSTGFSSGFQFFSSGGCTTGNCPK